MSKDQKNFGLSGDYLKSGLMTDEKKKLEVESRWNEAASKEGMLRFTLNGSERFTVRAMDLISTLMAHSGEEQARHMSDGLMHRTKKKYIISYPFHFRVQRMHLPGEVLRCEIQIEVPEELMDRDDLVRTHIVNEKPKNGIIIAPKSAGQLPKGAPKIFNH